MIGLKIYNVPDNIDQFISKIKKLNVDSIFVGENASADIEFQNILKKNDFKIYYVFQTFYSPEYLNRHPESYSLTEDGKIASDEWVKFVCPTDPEYKIFLKDRLHKIITTFDPYAISLDFIRQFVFWEKIVSSKSERLIRSCCCKRCKSDKRSSTEIITDTVKELSSYCRELKNSIIVDLHAVPWMKGEYNSAGLNIAGQDLSKISNYVDFITPMCYSHMLKKEPEWVNRVVKDHYNQSGINIIPAIQVKECYIKEKLSDSDYKLIVKNALKQPSKGIIIWNWESLESTSKYDITLKLLGS